MDALEILFIIISVTCVQITRPCAYCSAWPLQTFSFSFLSFLVPPPSLSLICCRNVTVCFLLNKIWVSGVGTGLSGEMSHLHASQQVIQHKEQTVQSVWIHSGGENAACCLDPVFLVNIRTGSDHFNQHDYKRVKLRLSSSHVCKLLLEKDPEKVKHFGFQS